MQHTYNFLLSCLHLKRSSCNWVCNTHSDHQKGISSHSTVLGSSYTICSSLTSIGCDTNGKCSIWSPRKLFPLQCREDSERQFLERSFLPSPNKAMSWKKVYKVSITRNCQTFLLCIFQLLLLQVVTCKLQLIKLGEREVNIYLKGNRIPSTKITSQKEL